MRTIKEITEEAFAYHKAGNLDMAARIYDQLLGQLEKPDPNVLFGYGTLLVGQQKYGLGMCLLRASISIYPKHAATWANLGCACKFMGRDEEAWQAYLQADALEPNTPDVLAGMAGYWVNKNESGKVEEFARRALAVAPNHEAANMHLALALLEQGRYEEAWPRYEWRWETTERKNDKRPYKAPRWDGKKVNFLAIHGEQGLGDEILFMSLFPKARELANEIVIECAERLVPTFKDSFGVRCYPDHKTLIENEGEPDAYIPMGSLPLVLGNPDGKPFLKRPHFVSSGKPKIGIAWRGGTVRTNHKERSIKLEMLRPIFDVVDADFISIQYGDDDVEREGQENGLITGPRDFDSLHRRIAMCDLVISACQTSVHQAGAMGVDCWVMTPKRAAWRYCRENMMPWYESVRLFRQENDGEWEPVIEKIAEQLGARYAAIAA